MQQVGFDSAWKIDKIKISVKCGLVLLPLHQAWDSKNGPKAKQYREELNTESKN